MSDGEKGSTPGGHTRISGPSLPAGAEGREVLDAIRRIVQIVRRSAQSAEKRVGLSSAQLYALHKLADAPSLSLNELSQRTLTTQSSVSEVVQKLVTRGLVARKRSSRDARGISLSLTEQGRGVLSRAPAPVQDEIVRGVEKLDPAERRQLAFLLGRLTDALGIASLPAGMLMEEVGAASKAKGENPPHAAPPA